MIEAEQMISLESFELFFKEQYAGLCALANHYLNDLEDAEEVVQSAFVKLWEQRNSLSIQHSLKAYMNQAVRNSCLNELKHIKVKETFKEHNQRELNSWTLETNADVDNDDLEKRVQNAINRLPEGRRKIFRMSRFEGMKYKEIASELNISIKTVENQMGSALRQLKEELSAYIVLLALLLFQGWN